MLIHKETLLDQTNVHKNKQELGLIWMIYSAKRCTFIIITLAQRIPQTAAKTITTRRRKEAWIPRLGYFIVEEFVTPEE